MLQRLRKAWVQVLLSAIVVGAFLLEATPRLEVPFMSRLEQLAYDARLRLAMPGGIDDRIVIVDIDEKSLKEEGRWPWGRDKVARLTSALFDDYGVGLLGFDIVFAEPDESSGLGVLEALADNELKGLDGFREQVERLRPQLDRDRIFAQTLAQHPVVLGYYFNSQPDLASGSLPPAAFTADDFRGRKINFERGLGFGANLEALQEAALSAGHFNPSIDNDGVVRRVPLLYEYEGDYYEALALTLARLALNAESLVAGFPEQSRPGAGYQGMEWLLLGEVRIPVDERVQALVPYRGPAYSFPYVSATDILNGRASRAQLKGRIALVGTSAPGLQDLRSTPVQKTYPGVEVHANLLAGILDGRILEDPPYTIGANFVLLVLFGTVLALLLPALSPAPATALALGALLGFIGINFLAWHSDNLLLSLVPGVLMIILLYVTNMAYGFFVESRGRRQLAGLFGQYVPPELVDEMSDDPVHYSMVAESRYMSVLFCDVRGFTTISEGLTPPELAALMSEFLTPMTAIIHKHRGTIDKYMGDAVMGFWGAPLNDPQHALHAVECAMGMVAEVRALAPHFAERGWPPMEIGVGVNSGVMSVGDMGSRFRRAYTVLGDAVNLGSRLEGQTKTYGVQVIVGEGTKEDIPQFVFRELDRIRVKGKLDAVTIFEPLGLRESVTPEVREELTLYRQALAQYRAQSWDSAEIQFVNLRSRSPGSRLYALYVERIKYFRKEPPSKDWDGTFTFDTK